MNKINTGNAGAAGGADGSTKTPGGSSGTRNSNRRRSTNKNKPKQENQVKQDAQGGQTGGQAMKSKTAGASQKPPISRNKRTEGDKKNTAPQVVSSRAKGTINKQKNSSPVLARSGKKAIKRPQTAQTPSASRGGKGSKLKVIPLGGLGEIGKNMTVIQYDNEMVVIDGGVMFPEDELLGIDLVIPDYTYLRDNKEKVKAILLTHGHEDHIGGVPYLLKEIKAPVYGSRLTLGLLQGKLREHKIKADLHEVTGRQKVKIGPFTIEFVRVSHSIPDTLSMAVHTPLGSIVFICDFKLDMSPVDGQLIDLDTLGKLGQRGVLLMMSDSTNVEKKGFTPSEKTVGEAFDRLFAKASGRIIVTSFASNVHRIQQAFWAAEGCGRKVAVVGRGIQNVTSIAMELGYLKITPGQLIDIDQINKYRDDEIVIITTGSQGEPLSGLTRMSLGEHRQVHIGAGDMVVISATPIPGNERLIARTVDNLYRLGATVVHGKDENIHVSGHASQDELSIMLNLLKPRFFLPVHGEYRMLYKHALLAQTLGMEAENTFVMENGQILEVGRRHSRIRGTVPSGRVLIDGLGVGDVGNSVLKDRRLLSESGIVVINMVLDKKSGIMLYGPEITSRGFVFERNYEHIIKEAREKVIDIYAVERAAKEKSNENINCSAIKSQISSALTKSFFNKTGRRPIILPLITKV